jgi:hypothetical protein
MKPVNMKPVNMKPANRSENVPSTPGPGRKSVAQEVLRKENSRLKRQNKRLERKLKQTEAVLEVQKKLYELMGIPLDATDLDEFEEELDDNQGNSL